MRNVGVSEAVSMGGSLESGNRVESPADAVVIDLRDPSVADGLASMLDQVSEFSHRAGAAEAKADAAFHDRLAVTGRLRAVNDELEFEQSERHRLEIDNAELRRENEVRLEQLDSLEAQLTAAEARVAAAESWAAAAESREAVTRSDLEELASATDEVIDWLQNELRRTKKAKHILEALVSKRRLRHYQQLVGTAATSDSPET